jgi:hypothetical protein
VQLTNESDVVAQMERVLEKLVHDRNLLGRLRKRGMAYARERLTWDAKAHDTTQILRWVLGLAPKPGFVLPKASAASSVPYAQEVEPQAETQ